MQRDRVANQQDDRNQLITIHLEMALKTARKIARRLPSSVSQDDIESAAMLGLTEAASRYDTRRTEPFMAFAAKRVRGAILDYLRKNDILSRRARQSARRVADTIRELEAQLGRVATDGEVAESMGLTEMKFNRLYAGIRDVSFIQLDDVSAEFIAAGTSRFELREKQREKMALTAALSVLDEREQRVLSCYYREGLTLREIGSLLGVTESRACQLHTQALALLRAKLS